VESEGGDEGEEKEADQQVRRGMGEKTGKPRGRGGFK